MSLYRSHLIPPGTARAQGVSLWGDPSDDDRVADFGDVDHHESRDTPQVVIDGVPEQPAALKELKRVVSEYGQATMIPSRRPGRWRAVFPTPAAAEAAAKAIDCDTLQGWDEDELRAQPDRRGWFPSRSVQLRGLPAGYAPAELRRVVEEGGAASSIGYVQLRRTEDASLVLRRTEDASLVVLMFRGDDERPPMTAGGRLYGRVPPCPPSAPIRPDAAAP
eukprot:gene31146-37657_t